MKLREGKSNFWLRHHYIQHHDHYISFIIFVMTGIVPWFVLLKSPCFMVRSQCDPNTVWIHQTFPNFHLIHISFEYPWKIRYKSDLWMKWRFIKGQLFQGYISRLHLLIFPLNHVPCGNFPPKSLGIGKFLSSTGSKSEMGRPKECWSFKKLSRLAKLSHQALSLIFLHPILF